MNHSVLTLWGETCFYLYFAYLFLEVHFFRGTSVICCGVSMWREYAVTFTGVPRLPPRRHNGEEPIRLSKRAIPYDLIPL